MARRGVYDERKLTPEIGGSGFMVAVTALAFLFVDGATIVLETARTWSVSVDRGPDWLFIRLEPASGTPVDYAGMAEQVWQVVQQHFVYRVVLEMQGVTVCPSSLIGQLVLLHKRLHTQGGVLRLCGLSPNQEQAIQCSRLDARFPAYPNREQAVWGHRPPQPR